MRFSFYSIKNTMQQSLATGSAACFNSQTASQSIHSQKDITPFTFVISSDIMKKMED